MQRDEPEAVFVQHFRAYAKLRGVTDSDLLPFVARYASSTEIVSNWRRGRTAIPLGAMPIISKALGMGGDNVGHDDSTFILREMGLLEDPRSEKAARTSYSVQRLEMRLRELQNELGRLDRSNGVANIARMARDSAEWAMAMWPVMAGPAQCRMHVEDRIDLRRVDGSAVGYSVVFDDPLWHDVLRRTHAIPARHDSRWTHSDASVSKWTISHARTPTLPSVRRPHPSTPSACIYGINIDSGVNEVAKLVSVALGYGLTLTRDEAMELMGIPAWLGATEWEPRARAHQNHLEDPPSAVIWAHHAPPLVGANPDVFAVASTSVPIFWLRESEALFHRYCTRWPQAAVDHLLKVRSRLDSIANQRANVIVISVDSTTTIDREWAQHIDTAIQILQHPRMLPALHQSRGHWPSYMEQDKDIARPFLNWLESRLEAP
jgi:hypothetical protein